MKKSELFPPRGMNGNGNGHHGKPQIVATYDYCDANGGVLYQAVRYKPKDFRQRKPDGKGGWEWNMQGVDRVLYRLPELLRAIALSSAFSEVRETKPAVKTAEASAPQATTK